MQGIQQFCQKLLVELKFFETSVAPCRVGGALGIVGLAEILVELSFHCSTGDASFIGNQLTDYSGACLSDGCPLCRQTAAALVNNGSLGSTCLFSALGSSCEAALPLAAVCFDYDALSVPDVACI